MARTPIASTSVRLRILDLLSSALQSVCTAHGAHFERNPPEPLSADLLPALVLRYPSELVQRVGQYSERTLVLLLTPLARSTPDDGQSQEAVADSLLAAAHCALFDPELWRNSRISLVAAITEINTEYKYDASAYELAQSQTTYQLIYRTAAGDITASP